MSTLATADPGDTLFGQTRRQVLALLLGRPDERFHLREVARTVGGGMGSVQRELAALGAAGLIRREAEGRQVYFSADPQSPIFHELKGIIEKTAGIGQVLRSVLAPWARKDRIRLALIYGSAAARALKQGSDVDLLVVGDVTLGELLPAIRKAERRLSREINLTIYPEAEFRARLRTRAHFISRVLEGPKTFLIGDADVAQDLAE